MDDNNKIGETKSSLLSCVLDYLEAREATALREQAEIEASYMLRKQRLLQFHERQRSELVELRRCLEYMNEHALVISSALRAAAGEGGSSAVPLSASLVRDIAAMKQKMEQSISNAVHIRSILSQRHQPLMDDLLRKMENELSGWTVFLSVASRALVNSGAVMENVKNLIAAQQKICAEVASSELFLSVKDDDISPPRETGQPAQLSSTPVVVDQH